MPSDPAWIVASTLDHTRGSDHPCPGVAERVAQQRGATPRRGGHEIRLQSEWKSSNLTKSIDKSI
jgi:hypothetical protein